VVRVVTPELPVAKPDSNNLRQKVIQAIELDGLNKSEASELFNISRFTINLLLQRKAATKDLQPKPRQASSQGQQSTDWEKFRVVVQAHSAQTQAEMAQLSAGEISARTISGALKQMGVSRKKQPRGSENRMKQRG